MIRRQPSQISRAGHAIGDALHTAGDAVGNFADEAQDRALRAGEVLRNKAQRALPSVGGVRGDLYETGRRLTRSVSRQPDDPMLWALAAGLTVGFIAGWLLHRR